MTIHTHGRVLAFFFICSVLLALPYRAEATDRDVLLDIVPLLALPLNGWSSSSTSNICTWDRIQCDMDGRVISLDLSSADDATTPLLRGSIPQSIAQLDRLQIFSMEHGFVYGNLPQSLFTLPNIREIYLSNTGLTIDFPANISSTITRLKVSATKVVSKIPDANWNTMEIFQMDSTGVSCPFPPSLVAHFSTGGSLTECSFASNNLTLGTDNLVCGQVISAAVSCAISPLGHVAPFFANDDQRQVTKYSAQLGNFTFEFNENEAMIFTTYYTRSGAPRAYRREYISFRLMPISDTYGAENRPKFSTLDMPVWDKFILERNRLRANSSITNGLVQEFIFDYIESSSPPSVKISNNVYNLDHIWVSSPNRVRKVSIFFILSFRIALSPPNGPAMTCVRGSGGGSRCNSSIAEVSSVIDLNTGNTILRVITRTINMEYAYALVGSVDGQPLLNSNARVNVRRSVNPYGSARWLEAVSRGGFILQSNASEAEQSFYAPVELQVPEFRDKFLFDPDVSITLLFDPRDSLPPESSDEAREAATPVALIVSLVVVAVVVIAAGTLFATVIYPYMKGREKQNLTEAAQETELEDETQQSGWKRVEKPSSTTT